MLLNTPGMINSLLIFIIFFTFSCAKNEDDTLIRIGRVQEIWSGTKLLGSTTPVAETKGRGTVTDSSGNIYITGSTSGGLEDQSLSGSTDSFLLKYNTAGVIQWIRMLGDSGATTEARAVTLDSTNNIYVAGFTTGDLDDKTVTGNHDFFVTKYNSSGVKQWTQLLGIAARSTYGQGITADGANNIYVTGYTDGNLDGVLKSGHIDMFITKYNSSGVKQWTRLLGPASGSAAYAFSISADSESNVYVGGHVNANLDGELKTGGIDFFITKFNSAGVKQWTRLLGVAAAFTVGRSLAVDNSNNVYLCGETNGNLDNEGHSPGAWFSFVTKYSAGGVKQWTRLLGAGSSETYCWGIAPDTSGNLFLTGSTTAALDGNAKLGMIDAFVSKYDSSGMKLWTKQMGVDSSNTEAHAIDVNSEGSVFVNGFTNGPLDGKILTGTYDSFTTKFNSSGVKQ